MSFIGQLIVTFVVAIFGIAAPTSNALASSNHIHKHTHRIKHHVGCNTRACDKHIDTVWSKAHKKVESFSNSSITMFDLCVANNENGEPGSTNYNDIDWQAINGYYGAYSFLQATWEAAGGMRYAKSANLATPAEQSAVFNHYSAIDPGAWPNTIPPCEGYR